MAFEIINFAQGETVFVLRIPLIPFQIQEAQVFPESLLHVYD